MPEQRESSVRYTGNDEVKGLPRSAKVVGALIALGLVLLMGAKLLHLI